MYETAMKNIEKPEFDWDSNESCLDFHLIVDGEDNYFYSGSYCYTTFEYYNGMNGEDELDEYYLGDFKEEAEKIVKRFLNRKNKKQYEIDEHLETINFDLWNQETEQYDSVELSLQLTYCP